jgi:hypothetical protein
MTQRTPRFTIVAFDIKNTLKKFNGLDVNILQGDKRKYTFTYCSLPRKMDAI